MRMDRRIYVCLALKVIVLVALFWTLWYCIAGQVPVITSQQMNANWTIHFSFGISRFSDVLFAPIWSTILALIYFEEGVFYNSDDAIRSRIGFCFVAGLLCGLLFYWASSDKPESTLYFLIGGSVISALITGFPGEDDGFKSWKSFLLFGLILNLVFGLGLGLAYSLPLGLGPGLVLSVVFGLVSGLGFILVTCFLICAYCVYLACSVVVRYVSRLLGRICEGICAKI